MSKRGAGEEEVGPTSVSVPPAKRGRWDKEESQDKSNDKSKARGDNGDESVDDHFTVEYDRKT